MTKAFSLFLWENSPSVNTPLGETLLNRVNVAVNEIDNRVLNHETTKANQSDLLTALASVSYDESTGKFTFIKKNGAATVIDTKLEKIAVNFTYDSENQRLVLTLSDGTIQYVDMKALITELEFLNSDTVLFSVTDGKVSASIAQGSITGDMLEPNYLANVQMYASEAFISANDANTYASQASSNASIARQSAAMAVNTRGEVEELAADANLSKVSASESAKSANVSAANAKASEQNAKTSEENAQSYKNTAQSAASSAEGYASYAYQYYKNAESNAQAAKTSAANAKTSEENASKIVEDLQTSIDDLVPKTRTVNGKALSEDITLSASDVGADASGSADAALSEAKKYTDNKAGNAVSSANSAAASMISNHNTSTKSHNDIRLLIEELTTRLNALADSDDTTLDQMSEIVAYIKSNKNLIDSITTSKVSVADIIDNLTTNAANKPLSAAQGVVIKDLIDALQTDLNNKIGNLSGSAGDFVVIGSDGNLTTKTIGSAETYTF